MPSSHPTQSNHINDYQNTNEEKKEMNLCNIEITQNSMNIIHNKEVVIHTKKKEGGVVFEFDVKFKMDVNRGILQLHFQENHKSMKIIKTESQFKGINRDCLRKMFCDYFGVPWIIMKNKQKKEIVAALIKLCHIEEKESDKSHFNDGQIEECVTQLNEMKNDSIHVVSPNKRTITLLYNS